MATEYLNRLSVFGSKAEITEFSNGVRRPDGLEWEASGEEDLMGTFVTRGVEGFEVIRVASADFTGLVFQVSSVAAENEFAQARVFRGGEELGQYDMPSDEFRETAGDEMDEGAVLDNLDATVNAYVSDELEKVAGNSAGPALA